MYISNTTIMKKVLSLLFALAVTSLTYAQRDFSKIEIKTEQVTDNIYVLFGSGGNIGVYKGKEQTLMIDDQFAPLSEKILAAVQAISDKPIQYLINTHWHGDHTGGNENIAKHGATIVAHTNVHTRMSEEQKRPFGRTTAAAPEIARPKITFSDEMTFRIDDEQIMLIHVDNAHTDGDAWVYFVQSNVLHMGDTYFQGRFPYIDLGSGGSVMGVLEALNKALVLVDEETKIIPGHGQLSNREELRTYRNMVGKLHERVRLAIEAGQSLEEIKAANLTKGYESYDGGFISADKIVDIIYTDLSRE